MTKISWTDASWQPVVGCTKCSPGCENCYAERMAWRLAMMGQSKYRKVIQRKGDYNHQKNRSENMKPCWNNKVFCDESVLDKPLHLKNPRRIFVCSMGDLFHEAVLFEFIAGVFLTIAGCCKEAQARQLNNRPIHTLLVLTKRVRRMLEFITTYKFGSGKTLAETPLSNVHLGVSISTQAEADEKIPILLQIPAAVRFVSLEPLLSKIILDNKWLTGYNTDYESKKQRKHSVSSGASQRIGNRQCRTDMAIDSSEGRQVEGGKQKNSLPTETGGKQHGEISASENNGRRQAVSHLGSQAGMVSSQWRNSNGANNQSQKRKPQRQPVRKSGISNNAGTGDARNRSFGSNIQQGQLRKISWIIVGCESINGRVGRFQDGFNQAAINLVEQCDAAGVPVFVKQIPLNGKVEKDIKKFPPKLQRQEMPE